MMKNIVFAWSDRPVKMHGYSDGWVGACDDIEERGVAVRRPRRKMGSTILTNHPASRRCMHSSDDDSSDVDDLSEHKMSQRGKAIVFDFSQCKIRGPRLTLCHTGRLSFSIFIAIQIINSN